MNKKQLICMWVGIAVFVCLGYFSVARDPLEFFGLVRDPFQAFADSYSNSTSNRNYNYGPLIVRLSGTVLVTVGLICTLKDKKAKPKDGSAKENDSKPKTD